MTESDYLELRFIQAELQRYGLELRELMVSTISSKDIVSKENVEHTRDSITFKVTQDGEKGGRLQFFFPDKGRLVEIMYRKIGSRAKLSSRASADEASSGLKDRSKNTKKKDVRWYNLSVFGTRNDLIGRIMYGFTEAARLDLKQQLNLSTHA